MSYKHRTLEFRFISFLELSVILKSPDLVLISHPLDLLADFGLDVDELPCVVLVTRMLCGHVPTSTVLSIAFGAAKNIC